MKQVVVSDNCHSKLKVMMQHKRETYGDVVERLIQEHIGNQVTKEKIDSIPNTSQIEDLPSEKLQSPELPEEEIKISPEPRVSIMKSPDGTEFHILS